MNRRTQLALTTVVWLICGSPDVLIARCLPRASYRATVKVNECDEVDGDSVFIRGELLKISQAGGPPTDIASAPRKGERYLFFKSLSPLVRDADGRWQKRKPGYCRERTVDSLLEGVLTRPCCDANYPWCERHVDFVISEPES